MPLFPMFVDLHAREILVVGGGEVALRKIEQLVKFSPKLTVIAPAIHDEILRMAPLHGIRIETRPYRNEDLAGQYLVIGALNDVGEQENIHRTCIAANIPVNCVDSPHLCSFIFPALIVEGDLCVGINTSGRAPAVSSALRQYLGRLIPARIGELIERVDAIRRGEVPGKKRQEKIIGICREFFDTLKQ